MKKFALALMASAAMVLGFGAVASAYPPGAGAPVITNGGALAPGAEFTVTAECQPVGAQVTFEFQGVTLVVECVAATGSASLLGSFLGTAPAAGTATATFTAPTAPGTYTGTYTGAAVGTFSVTVAAPVTPGGGLPATGSNGTSTMTIIAIGLFAVGAGLFGVSQVRRRTVGV